MPDGCTVKDMKMSGNTATYRMECVKDPKMTVDTTMTFAGDDFTMKQKMAMNQGGQVMNMNKTMTGRYTGPCRRRSEAARRGPRRPRGRGLARRGAAARRVALQGQGEARPLRERRSRSTWATCPGVPPRQRKQSRRASGASPSRDRQARRGIESRLQDHDLRMTGHRRQLPRRLQRQSRDDLRRDDDLHADRLRDAEQGHPQAAGRRRSRCTVSQRSTSKLLGPCPARKSMGPDPIKVELQQSLAPFI